MSPHAQQRFGAFVILLGVGLGLYLAIKNNFGFVEGDPFHNNLLILMGTKGPAEICGAGIVIWLTAKWRKGTRL
jgi:hypothetical protein